MPSRLPPALADHHRHHLLRLSRQSSSSSEDDEETHQINQIAVCTSGSGKFLAFSDKFATTDDKKSIIYRKKAYFFKPNGTQRSLVQLYKKVKDVVLDKLFDKLNTKPKLLALCAVACDPAGTPLATPDIAANLEDTQKLLEEVSLYPRLWKAGDSTNAAAADKPFEPSPQLALKMFNKALKAHTLVLYVAPVSEEDKHANFNKKRFTILKKRKHHSHSSDDDDDDDDDDDTDNEGGSGGGGGGSSSNVVKKRVKKHKSIKMANGYLGRAETTQKLALTTLDHSTEMFAAGMRKLMILVSICSPFCPF